MVRLTRLLLLVATAAVIAVPSGAFAGNHHHQHHGGKFLHHAIHKAKKSCRAERETLGKDAFKEKYGRHAMRKCVRANVREQRAEVKAAAKSCRSERREIGKDAFNEKYGKHHTLRKCVRSHLVMPEEG